MFDLTFGGRGPELLKAGKDTVGLFEGMLTWLRVVITIDHVPALTPLLKILPIDPKVEQFVELCTQFYRARVDDPSPSHDIFHHFVSGITAPSTSRISPRIGSGSQPNS